jgi:ketosteroid isomerase-like protein
MRAGLCTALFIALAANSALAQAAQRERTQDGAERALLAADKAWEAVYSAKDLGKSVAACDDQASFLWPNAPIALGKKAIAKAILYDFSTGDLAWRPNAVGVARSGDLGYTTGVYESKLNGKAGGAVDNGKYLTLWKREANGGWKVLFDMFNSDRPSPAN